MLESATKENKVKKGDKKCSSWIRMKSMNLIINSILAVVR